MEHTQRKAWAMKHPALARVFAVVLAVMSVILIFSGVNGLGKNEEENEERIRYEDRFQGRIENYVELSEKLENSISYDEAYAELEKILEQHEDDAAQHRTDLALYSAEKGGNTMGANMIWEMLPDPQAARQQLEEGKAQLAAGEAQLQAVQALYASNEAGINAVAGEAAAAANSAEFSNINEKINNIYALIETQPALPQEPGLVEMPAETLEHPGDAPEAPGNQPGEDASQEELDAWQAKKDAYDAYELKLQAYNENQNAWTAYNTYINETLHAYQQAMAAYPTNYGMWMAGVGAALGEVTNDTLALGATVQSISGKAMGYFTMFGVDTGAMGGGTGGGSGDMGAADPSTMTPEQSKAYFSAAAGAIKAQLSAMQTGLNGIAYGLGQIGSGLAASAAQMAEARAQLDVAEKGLHEAQKALEDIWYNLGELEKERAELEEQKIVLDEEAAALSKQIMETDELRELENDHTSAKLLLTSVKEVNDMVEEGGEIVPSAEKYLEDYKADTEKLYTSGIVVNILAILSGLAGLAAVPAAYEKLKKRFWLIAPVLVCIALAAGSELLNMYIGQGQMYPALFTVVIAAIHLLVVLPKEKRPAGITET